MTSAFASRAVFAVLMMWIVGTPAVAAPPLDEHVRACAACHGAQGRSSSEAYYPSIAGKPAGYLYAQLVNFRDGRRQHAVMAAMLAYLSDDYLREIGEYYAAQAPNRTPRKTTVSDEVLAQGRRLTEAGDASRDIPACTACHGASLKGVAPAIPGLLGLPAEYLSAQIGAWQSGVRHAAEPDCMASIAHALDNMEISAITAWIASLPYPEDYAPDEVLTAALPMPCGVVP